MFKRKKKWRTHWNCLMRGEEEAIVQDSFDKIQEKKKQDDNEEEEVS